MAPALITATSVWADHRIASAMRLPMAVSPVRTVAARLSSSTAVVPIGASAAVTAVTLALAYLSLGVRTLYHGEVLTEGPTTNAEQYSYSAVWLAFGVAAGGRRAAALASGKVRFCCGGHPHCVQGLPGRHARSHRHLSGPVLIELGVVLLGIGWFYQR